MALFKDDKEIETKNSMSNFLFSNNANIKKPNKSSTLMFGGEYSNNEHLEKYKRQKNENKKVPMFGGNGTVNSNNGNKNNNSSHTFDFPIMDSKPYNVVNFEHQKMLTDLRGLIDYYINIFSDEDRQKICFLIDKLKSDL